MIVPADPDPPRADSITVLRAKSGFSATKQQVWRADPGRWDQLDYNAGRWFSFEECPVAGVRDMGALLNKLRHDPRAMVVRGAMSQAARDYLAQHPNHLLARKLSGARELGTLDDVPRRWLMTDIDKFPVDPLELIDDPEAVVARAIATMLPPEFQEVTCFWQLSSSAGFKPATCGIHLWWWVDRPFENYGIRRWLKERTADKQRGACKVDCGIISANIPHYIADPIITGAHDPLPRRTGFIEGDAEEVSLPAAIQTTYTVVPVVVTWSGPEELRAQHDKVRAALEYVPNDDLDYDEWVAVGFAIKAHLGDAGRDLWIAWSRTSTKASPSDTADSPEHKWPGVTPTRTSGEYIFRRARAAGWTWDDNAIPVNHGLPAYYDAPSEPREVALQRQNDAIRSTITAAAARAVLTREIRARRKVAREAAEAEAEAAAGDSGDMAEDAEALFDERKSLLTRAELAKISRTIKAAVLAEHGMTRLPAVPRTLVTGAQGTGKTQTAIETLAALRGDVVARVLVPLTVKADEFVAEYRDRATADSLPIIAIRGRGAADSYAGGKTMCGRIRAVTKAVEKGLNVRKSICAKCPLRRIPMVQPGCGYMRQESAIEAMGGRGIFVGAHHYLFLVMPSPAPDVVIVDEAVPMTAAEVMDLAPDALRDPLPYRGGGALAEIIAVNRTVNAILKSLQASDPRAALADGGITRSAITAALAALQAAKDSAEAPITGDMPDNDLVAALDAMPDDRITPAIAVLAALAREWDVQRPLTGITFNPAAEVSVDGKRERMPRLRVHRLRDPVGITAQTGLLLMDGTGDAWLNEALFGKLAHVHTPVERDAHVTGTTGKSYSRQSITGLDRNGNEMAGKADDARRLRRDIATIAARQPGSVLVVATLAAAEAIAPDLPANAQAAWSDDKPPHFGAVRGLNIWEDCDTALIVGRESVSVEAVERLARCFAARDPEPFISYARPIPTGWRTGWPFTATRGRRMRDGTVLPVEVEVHPDPRCQAVLEQIREAEIVQAADRVRPVFNRRRVVLANNLVLPVTYDRIMTHAELVAGGGRFEQAFAATGVVPLGAADLHAAHPALFATETAAKHALHRAGESGTNVQIVSYLELGTTFSYRRQGQRGSTSRAIIDTRRHSDPRAALEAALGAPLAFCQAEGATTAATEGTAPQSGVAQAGLHPLAMLAPMMLTAAPSDSWRLPNGRRIETAPAVTAAPARGLMPPRGTTRLTVADAAGGEEVLLADLTWHAPVTALTAPSATFADMPARLALAARQPVPAGFLGLVAPSVTAAAA